LTHDTPPPPPGPHGIGRFICAVGTTLHIHLFLDLVNICTCPSLVLRNTLLNKLFPKVELILEPQADSTKSICRTQLLLSRPLPEEGHTSNFRDAVFHFYAGSQNCEKRLLASSCLSVCLYVCLSVGLAVCLHGTTRLTPDRSSIHLTFYYFSKICPENSSLIKILQE
jgi:hypothetical protein